MRQKLLRMEPAQTARLVVCDVDDERGLKKNSQSRTWGPPTKVGTLKSPLAKYTRYQQLLQRLSLLSSLMAASGRVANWRGKCRNACVCMCVHVLHK